MNGEREDKRTEDRQSTCSRQGGDAASQRGGEDREEEGREGGRDGRKGGREGGPIPWSYPSMRATTNI